jgi:hypothetical protein
MFARVQENMEIKGRREERYINSARARTRAMETVATATVMSEER